MARAEARDLSSPPPPRRFALTGPSASLDPATYAFREDIADISLAGQVVASHYAEPAIRATTTRTALQSTDGVLLLILDEGVGFAVLDCGGGRAWGFTLPEHRVGYVDEVALG